MRLDKLKLTPFPDEVMAWCQEHSRSEATSFVAWFEYIDGEIIERDFATRKKKGRIYVTEVLRCSTRDGEIIVKNLLFSYTAGYRAVYEAGDVYSRSQGWSYKVFDGSDFDVWDRACQHIGYCVYELNAKMVFDIPEFKYCGYSGGGLISYLKKYRKDPSVEMFGKLGLTLSPVLMKKAKNDGKFRRFLFENHRGIQQYGTQAAIYAYNNGVSVADARLYLHEKNQRDRLCAYRISEVKGTKIDRARLLDYVGKSNIDYALYNDYLKALKALGYDLADTKNIYPHDFMAMHDLRIAEYEAHEAKLARKKRAKLYRDFRRASKDARIFEQVGEVYSIIVPSDIADLKREGKLLDHCVGRMGYDKKMADGISLIMFVRENAAPDTPYVTVEYRLDRNALNQCYGYHDSKPSEEVIAFVNDWADNVTKQRKEAARVG